MDHHIAIIHGIGKTERGYSIPLTEGVAREYKAIDSNNADNLIYQTEKALRDLGDKVPSAERGAIETKINDLKSAAQTDDINRIKQATDEVQNAFHALSQQLYAQGQPQPQGGPSAPPPSNAGDVIDGEVRE